MSAEKKRTFPSWVTITNEETEISTESQDALKTRIKDTIKKEKLSFSWLAEKLGLAHGTVRNWFYSEARITEENVAKIDKILGSIKNTAANYETGYVCIFPTREGARDEWGYVFGDESDSKFDATIKELLDNTAESFLKSLLKGKSIKVFRELPLADSLTEEDTCDDDLYILFDFNEAFMWRKAAGAAGLTLNSWANRIIDDYIMKRFEKDLGLNS